MLRPRLDVAALSGALDEARLSRGLSWRDVAAQTGVSAATLSRLPSGGGIDVDNLFALTRWMGVPAEAFTSPRAPAGRPSSAEIEAGIRSMLTPRAARVMIALWRYCLSVSARSRTASSSP